MTLAPGDPLVRSPVASLVDAAFNYFSPLETQPLLPWATTSFHAVSPSLPALATVAERVSRRTRVSAARDSAYAICRDFFDHIGGTRWSWSAELRLRQLVADLTVLNLALICHDRQEASGQHSAPLCWLPREIVDEIFFAAMPHDGSVADWNAARLNLRLLNTECAARLSRQPAPDGNVRYWTRVRIDGTTRPEDLLRCLALFENHPQRAILTVDVDGAVSEEAWKVVQEGSHGVAATSLFSRCCSLQIFGDESQWDVLGLLPPLPAAPSGLVKLRLVCDEDNEDYGYDMYDRQPLLVPSMPDPTSLRVLQLQSIDYMSAGPSWAWDRMVNLDTLDLACMSWQHFPESDLRALLQSARRLRVMHLSSCSPYNEDNPDFFTDAPLPIDVDSLQELGFAGVHDATVTVFMDRHLRAKNLKRLLVLTECGGEPGESKDESEDWADSWLQRPDYVSFPGLLELHLGIDKDTHLNWRSVFLVLSSLQRVDLRFKESSNQETMSSFRSAILDPDAVTGLWLVKLFYVNGGQEHTYASTLEASLLQQRPRVGVILFGMTAEEMERRTGWWEM